MTLRGKKMKYDVIIVGGGIAGLTSAAYLCKNGYKMLICEKGEKVGGLVNSFNYKGFTFDGGIRAIENSGVILPMLKDLNIDVKFKENIVSVGIGDKIVKVDSKESLVNYQNLLKQAFPQNVEDIEDIIKEIEKIMGYMDVLYGIDNPLFMDLKNNKKYLVKTVIPWSLKYLSKAGKINRLNKAVCDYLREFTKNEALIDMIAQHFFKSTPTFFALSYFSLYLDYRYPKGGTGSLIEGIKIFITKNEGDIKVNSEITKVNLDFKKLVDKNGNEYFYEKLIWAGDINTLYNSLEYDTTNNKKLEKKIKEKKKALDGKRGGDSVLTLYLTVDLDKSYFENICTEHFFYTPLKYGLNQVELDPLKINTLEKEERLEWFKKYLKLNTYEISIPAIRDETLAPKGKTGLIISILMDYDIAKQILNEGWYEEFKTLAKENIIDNLENSIFNGMKEKVIDGFVSTPITIEKLTGNTDGAITGWGFTNSFIPAENKMIKISKAVETVLSDVYQAGQWTYSPSGLPVAVITGKLAADKIINLK